MSTDRTRTFAQPLDLRWDGVTLLVLIDRADFDQITLKEGFRYDDKARRLSFVCTGLNGPWWETYARVKFGPAGVSLDLSAEQLRQHTLVAQRSIVDSLAKVAGDYRVTVPRLDWAVQYKTSGVDLRGRQEYGFVGDSATRGELLAHCASVGLFESGAVHKSNLPGRITSISGVTDYRLYRKTRRSGKCVERDEVVLRVYDAHGMGMAFLRAECQERLARRAFTGSESLAMHSVTWAYFMGLPSGLPCGLDGEVVRANPTGRDNIARSISSIYNSMFAGVDARPIDGNVDSAYALALLVRMCGYDFGRWPLLEAFAKPSESALRRFAPNMYKQQQLSLVGAEKGRL